MAVTNTFETLHAMFKVIFCKSIWDGDTPESSTTFALLRREETLPFAPGPGMEISWQGVPQAIVAVRWEPAESRFVCNMKDDCRHYIDVDTYDFEWLLRFAIDNGWSVVAKEKLSSHERHE